MKDYFEKSLRTNAPASEAIKRVQVEDTAQLLHAAMGLSTEANEFLDMMKKHIFYGKPLDYINAGEELGDIMWYFSLALSILKIPFDDILKKNIEKLQHRYPEKFSKEDALERDLEGERRILEGK